MREPERRGREHREQHEHRPRNEPGGALRAGILLLSRYLAGLSRVALYKTEYKFYANAAQEHSFQSSAYSEEGPMGAARATSYDELREAITDRYGALPRQLQRVAEVALERPHDLALKTVAALARRRRRAAVDAGSLRQCAGVRRLLGDAGAVPLAPRRSARCRIASASPGCARRTRAAATRPADILRGFVSESISGLEHLPAAIAPASSTRRFASWPARGGSTCSRTGARFRSRATSPTRSTSSSCPRNCSNGVGGMNEVYARRLGRKDALHRRQLSQLRGRGRGESPPRATPAAFRCSRSPTDRCRR